MSGTVDFPLASTPGRMARVQSPVIPLVAEWIRENPGTISLAQGVVYYPPPATAKEELDRFFADPQNHKYKPVQGIAELVHPIKTKLAAENGMEVQSSDGIVITAGANLGFMNAILAITDPGDDIILQTPYYFNHEMAVVMSGCRPTLVATDDKYQLRPDLIGAAISSRTRAVVTVSPNNPTGAVYSEEALRKVNELCRSRGIYHISDEAYEYFTYNQARHFSPASLSRAAGHTISLFSLSKAYGFASWRIGYMVIPEQLLVSVKKIQDTLLICPPVISQYAAIGALRAGAAYAREKIEVLSEIRLMILRELESIRNLCDVPQTDGAFYLLLNLRSSATPVELARKLISQFGVALLPGSAFGIEGACCLRLSYGALGKETAVEGMRRLVRGLKELVKP